MGKETFSSILLKQPTVAATRHEERQTIRVTWDKCSTQEKATLVLNYRPWNLSASRGIPGLRTPKVTIVGIPLVCSCHCFACPFYLCFF